MLYEVCCSPNTEDFILIVQSSSPIRLYRRIADGTERSVMLRKIWSPTERSVFFMFIRFEID
jgi:hypothetical protein